MNAAVFLDRDGVLNEVIMRDGMPGSPRALHELRLVPDIEAVRRLREAGLLVFIVTNQPDVSRGHVSLALVESMIDAIRAVVPVDDYRVCIHEDHHQCACRKPKAGMLHDLARRWHVDPGRSFVIGDMWRDVEAARAAGCRSVLVRRSYNEDTSADDVVDSLAEAVDLVVGETWGSRS